MAYLYHAILYQPLLNALVFFYNTIAFQDFGLSIVYLTVLIRLILFPLFHKGARHQAIMQRLQPELKKIQELHRGNKVKQAEATMEVYRKNEVNPFAPFVLLLVQLPILIALYQIFLKSFSPEFLSGLYSFVEAPTKIEPTSLGLIDLAKPSILMVGLAALAQYFQGRLALPKSEKGKLLSQAEKIGRQMVYVGPVLTLVIFYKLPAAIGLYWVVTSLFSIVQQIIINRQLESTKNGNLGKSSEKNN